MKEKYVELLLREYEKLPTVLQEPFLCMVANIEVAKELCKGPKMAEGKITKFSQIALEKEDYITF